MSNRLSYQPRFPRVRTLLPTGRPLTISDFRLLVYPVTRGVVTDTPVLRWREGSGSHDPRRVFCLCQNPFGLHGIPYELKFGDGRGFMCVSISFCLLNVCRYDLLPKPFIPLPTYFVQAKSGKGRWGGWGREIGGKTLRWTLSVAQDTPTTHPTPDV